ncbi:MAG: hypothetical protein HUJ25_08105 [Crocinitomicaceae bacterium]|nr:hypothetical protein [Crocinitomicaceae bacterium]
MSLKSKHSNFFCKNFSIYILSFFLVLLFQSNSIGQDTLQESSFYEKVLDKAYSVKDPSRQVGSFDPNSAPSLPLGIVKEINGNTQVICVDSAYFLPDGAYFSAYMALEFPNADKPIAFAAKDIKFNPEGVQGGEQAKLMLVSDHLLDLGPNTRMYLPGDGSNYVNWGCNGFESVNLHGKFIFSGNLLSPASPADTAVWAEFEVNVQDINNLMVQVNFAPFKITGLEDFEFTVTEATADMSDYVNPPGVMMPQCYHEIYPNEINLWRGFHLKYLEIQLPEKMSAANDPTEIYAQDMFIDEAGVTGFFGANNVLETDKGKTDGKWAFSIDNLEVGLTTNELTSGKMAGVIKVPMLDNSDLGYMACISKNPQSSSADYHFAINPTGTLSASAFNSTVMLDSTTVLSMTSVNDKFKPKMVMNGKWTLDKPNAKFEGVKFQNITLVTQSPYVSSGQFSLIGEATAELAKFKISINELTLGVYSNSKIGVGVKAGLNFTDQQDSSQTKISVDGGFQVLSKIDIDPMRDRQRWTYESFKIDQIKIEANTNAFKLDGTVEFKQNDPVWGDGFKGQLKLSITDVIENMAMLCIFGKTPQYKYWAVDVTAPLPGKGIPLGTSVYLTQLSGGLSYHMRDDRSAQDIIAVATAPMAGTNPAMSPDYVPDQSISVGFNAGVAFEYDPEKALNGDVVFGIQFNQYGGLYKILLAGEAYMMAKRDERATASNYAKGTIAIEYDNQDKIFDMQAQMNAQFAGALTASIWSQLYISPSLWYFHLGTPSNRCYVNIWNFASANAYFMFGQNLPPMPPPPPQVSSVLGGLQNGRNTNEIALGNGIGTGMSLEIGFGDELSISTNWEAYVDAYFGAGFDMTLYKYASSYHCQGSSGPFGANYWYLNGQLYAYGGLAAGVRKKNLSIDVPIIQASMATLLQGKLPKPTYVYGGVNLQANILNLFDVNLTVDFDAGTDCIIVN